MHFWNSCCEVCTLSKKYSQSVFTAFSKRKDVLACCCRQHTAMWLDTACIHPSLVWKWVWLASSMLIVASSTPQFNVHSFLMISMIITGQISCCVRMYRVNHGREWYLMLYINETLSHLQENTSKAPHTQTSSKKVISNDVVPIVSCPLQ